MEPALRQDEEGHLKSVLGVLFVAERAATYTEYHWPMPPQQQGEHRFVALGGKALQQLLIRELLDLPRCDQLLHMPQ